MFIGQLQGVIPGHCLWRAGFIITQRTHAGVAPDHIVRGDLMDEVLVHHIAQILHLLIIDADRAQIALVFQIGGANQREVLLIRDHKHDTFIFVLQYIGFFALMNPRHDHMAAFHQTDIAR